MADHAARAQSFGSVADEYDRARPGYPLAAVRWLLGSEPLDVVDLGAGTGKLTATLVAAGHRVVAIEPLAEMRAHLAANLPDVTVHAASAEATGLPDACADAVVAGAAFHWFDRDRAFPEIARILRRPGILGLLGNRFDRSVPWIEHYAEVAGSQNYGRVGHWPEAEELGRFFTNIDAGEFAHAVPIDRARLRDLSVSRSQVATLPEAEQRALLGRVDALWESEPGLRGRDSVDMTYLTRVRRAAGLH